MSTNIYVVTRAPRNIGNMAMTEVFMDDDGEVKSTWELLAGLKEAGATPAEVSLLTNLAMSVRGPAFSVGEILYLDPGGREVTWPGRKPSKWDVDVQHVGHIDAPGVLQQAIDLSDRVVKELNDAGGDPEVLDAIKSIKETQ